MQTKGRSVHNQRQLLYLYTASFLAVPEAASSWSSPAHLQQQQQQHTDEAELCCGLKQGKKSTFGSIYKFV
jgi:hypothetical protein